MDKEPRVSMTQTAFADAIVSVGEETIEALSEIVSIDETTKAQLERTVLKIAMRVSMKTPTRTTTQKEAKPHVGYLPWNADVEVIDNGDTITLKHPSCAEKTFRKAIAEDGINAIRSNPEKVNKRGPKETHGVQYAFVGDEFFPLGYAVFAAELLGLSAEQVSELKALPENRN